MPSQGDIVLIPVPFTDLSARKKRPAIVISNNAYNRGGPDVVVVAMTSHPAIVPYSFQISSADLVEGALNRPGTVRVDKVYTLANWIVVRRFGKVAPYVIDRIRGLFDTLTALTPWSYAANSPHSGHRRGGLFGLASM
jgi:mRNA interferase MazF